MSLENEKNNFVTPPPYSEFDIENLAIKMRSLGMGDTIHDDTQFSTNAWLDIASAEIEGGWTQELKDSFMEKVIKIKTRIS
ncbi:MAG: hypothetical protein WCO18_01180, partial [bacterium]